MVKFISITEFEQAQTAYIKGDYNKAQIILTKLYTNKKSLRTNYLLFRTLEKNEDFIAAYQLANEYLDDYLANNDWFKLYLQVGVKAGKNIKLWQLFAKIKPFLKTTEEIYIREILVADSNGAISQLQRQFTHLGAFELGKQKNIYEDAYALDKISWIKAAKVILTDETIHPIIRNSTLNDLQKLGYDQVVTFVTFTGEIQQLIPKNLADFDSSEAVITQEKFFENEIAQGNLDSLLKQREARLLLMLLYPNFASAKNLLGDYSKWYYLLVDESSRGKSDQAVDSLRKKVVESLLTWQEAWE